MNFYMENNFGVRKVYTMEDPTRYACRQIVADFVSGDAGDFAFACFTETLARRGGSLYCLNTRQYIVGDVAQLTGA